MDIDLIKSRLEENGFVFSTKDSGTDYWVEKYLRGDLWIQVSYEYDRKYLSVGLETRKGLEFYTYFREDFKEREHEFLEISLESMTEFMNDYDSFTRAALNNMFDDDQFIWLVLRNKCLSTDIDTRQDGSHTIDFKHFFHLGNGIESELHLRFRELELESYDIYVQEKTSLVILKETGIIPVERRPRLELKRAFSQLKNEIGTALDNTDFSYKIENCSNPV